MEIYKIKKKYCCGNRVQLMIDSARSQAIFNSSDTLYLKVPTKKETLVIHKYLRDWHRVLFPYHDVPASTKQNIHLFEINTIYAEISCSGFTTNLNFKLIEKDDNGDFILEELNLSDFDNEYKEIVTDAEGVIDYLKIKEDARYLFDWNCGIIYVSSKEANVNKINISLDNESIIKKYNNRIRPISFKPLYEENYNERKLNNDNSWMKTNINEIESFSLSSSNFFDKDELFSVCIRDNQIYASSYGVVFLEQNKFLIKEKIYKIVKEKFSIEPYIGEIDYLNEPLGIQTNYAKGINYNEEIINNMLNNLGITLEELSNMSDDELASIFYSKVEEPIIEEKKEQGKTPKKKDLLCRIFPFKK